MLSYSTLKSQFEETKESLDNIESRIKRLTGRNADEYAVTADGDIKLKNEGRPVGRLRGGFTVRKRRQSFQNVNRGNISPEDSPDDDDDTLVKHTLQSTIVATGRHAKSRKDMIKDQNYDSSGLARNRRMFGFVIGTLKKFEREESHRVNERKKRAAIDKKLEEAAEREREKMKEEKDHMFIEQREKKIAMRCLEKKMDILEMHEAWEKSQIYFKNFLKTDTKPSIMFLPSKHNVKTLKLLEEAKERRTNSIIARRAKVTRELSEIDDLYTREEKEEKQRNTSFENIENKSIFNKDTIEMEITLHDNEENVLKEIVSDSFKNDLTEAEVEKQDDQTKISEESRENDVEMIDVNKNDNPLISNEPINTDDINNEQIYPNASQDFEPIYDE